MKTAKQKYEYNVFVEELKAANIRTRCKYITMRMHINTSMRHLTKQENHSWATRKNWPHRETFLKHRNLFPPSTNNQEEDWRREKRGGQIKIWYTQSSLARATSIFLYVNVQIPTAQWTLQRSVQYLACSKDLLKQLFYLNCHFQLYEFSRNSLFTSGKKANQGCGYCN